MNLFSLFDGTNKLAKNIDCSGNTEIALSIDKALQNQNKQLSYKKRKKLGKIIYLNSLDFILKDQKITNEGKLRLENIKRYFGFFDTEIAGFNALRNQQAIKKLITQKYDDKILTDDEKQEIFEFASFLNLDPNTTEGIRKNIAGSIFKVELNSAVANKELSPKEENYLKQLLNKLELGDDIEKVGLSKSTINDLIFFKMFWQADNGYLLPLTNLKIALQRYEECYMGFPAKLTESKTITVGYKNINHGFSIPVIQGIRYRAGTGCSMPIRETVSTSYQGAIYLTDKRIIFSAGEGSFTLKFDKLISSNPYSDGIDFVIEGWVYTIKFLPLPGSLFTVTQMVDLYCAGLTSCIRYNQNPEDPVYLNALKDAKENEQLIKFEYAN